MEALYFEDFEVDREYVTRSRTVTETDVVTFAGISGDFNSLHMDEEFSRQSIFGARIAHGLLVLSISSGLIAQTGMLEGTVMALLGLTWNFKGPVRIGDTVTLRLRVIEKRETSKPDRGIVRLAVSVVNQRGEVVQEGERTILTKRRD
jgi:acyl dehydratase